MKTVAVVVAGLLSVFVIACGGSDSDSDSTGSDDAATLSMADAIAQGDQACQDASDGLGPIEKSYTKAISSGDLAGAADELDQIVELTQVRNEALADIQVEGADQDALDSYVANAEKTEELTQSMSDSLRDEDIAGITDSTQEIAKLNVEAQAYAQDFGFERCGSGATGAA
ncbi:MAG: hypothetical protein JJE13_03210 [Thermoleophilia bacterium]|nr:hypothetical protein [Thermoleophilia bacterium]